MQSNRKTPKREKFDDDLLLRSLVEGTSSETGSRFFHAVVKSFCQALGTYGAWITEYYPKVQRLRALAFWLGNDFVDHYEYNIIGTPCETAVKDKTYLHVPNNVIELFPDDPDLQDLGAVSYMGYPLLDTDNNVLGNIAVVDTKIMPESYRNLALFRIFAARSTAEILRLRAEADTLNHKRKLESVFDGTMDAIVELDLDFNILMLNLAAERIFGCNKDRCVGKAFTDHLRSEDYDRLTKIVQKFNSRPKSERSIWVPDGLVAFNADKKKFQAEATISQIESTDGTSYVLILRDINERYEAQKKIQSLQSETEYLKDEIQSLCNQGELIGESISFRKTLQLVAEVAPTDSTVLIYGETGTGKELVARAIHSSSARKDRPLITVNCAAIPEPLMESEFFGHEKGAFTGATNKRDGRFALADNGTIFLDEIGELSRDLQAKLLRVLQEGEYTPVGSSRSRNTDVRVIAATNRDLSMAVQDGIFRADLYYRLNVFPINIPPLNQRGDDIRLLAEHFVNQFSIRMGKEIFPFQVEHIENLKEYDWPGNVRELQNVIERGVITARKGRIDFNQILPNQVDTSRIEFTDLSNNSVKTVQQLCQLEHDNLLLALEKSQWRVAGPNGAAKLIGVPPSTLQSRMKVLGIKRPD